MEGAQAIGGMGPMGGDQGSGKKDSRRAGLTARKKGRHPRVREKNQPNKRREG